MYELRVTTLIAAPLSTCFDLARSVDAHVQSAAGTGERVVGGRLSGLLELDDEVTWEARHFGVTQQLSSKITEFRPHTFFQDRMIRGAFRFLEHDHLFEPQGDGTLMTDVLNFHGAPRAARLDRGTYPTRATLASVSDRARLGLEGDGRASDLRQGDGGITRRCSGPLGIRRPRCERTHDNRAGRGTWADSFADQQVGEGTAEAGAGNVATSDAGERTCERYTSHRR